MKQVYSDVFQYRGNHYNFGYMQGMQLKQSPIVRNRAKQWGPQKNRKFIINETKYKDVILHFAPNIWDEICGLADALEINMLAAIRDFGGYYLEYGKSGCSIFTNADYLIRNYDNDPLSYEGRFIFYQPSDGGYASIGPTMQITGRTDGINEKGLAMGYNFVNRKKSADGFMCNMIGRIVLEICANVDEAIKLLKEIPHRHSFNYVLVDQTKSIIVEASPRNVEIYQSNVCTNHFQVLEEENRYRMDDSIQRHQMMKLQQKSTLQAEYAFQLLNDTGKGVFSKKYGAWAGTIHTAAYFPKEMSVWFSLGGDQKPLVFNFKKWLQGENTNIKRVKGLLDARSGFVNMGLI